MVLNASKGSNSAMRRDDWEAALMVSGGAKSAPQFPATAIQERFGRSKLRQFEVVAGGYSTITLVTCRNPRAEQLSPVYRWTCGSTWEPTIVVQYADLFLPLLFCDRLLLWGHLWSHSKTGLLTTLLYDRYIPLLRAAQANKKEKRPHSAPRSDGTRGLEVEDGRSV